MNSLQVEVPTEMFRCLFEPQLRVWLDWARFSKEAWPVRFRVIDSVADAENLYTPWYLDPSGVEVDFDHANAEPIRALDVVRIFGRLKPERQKSIGELATALAPHRQPIQLPVALYNVGPPALLVLDGTHRLVAALASSHAFSLLTFTIDGPLDAAILPDLVHWRGKSGTGRRFPSTPPRPLPRS